MERKTKKPNNGNMRVASFSAHPEEIARWDQKAEAEHRTRSAWLRLRILEAEVFREEISHPLKGQ